MLGSEFPSRAARKRLVPLVTSLLRTSSARGIREMQGGDQPATGMELDLGWVSCSRVSGFSRGKPTLSGEGEPGQSVLESLHCMARAGDAWGST